MGQEDMEDKQFEGKLQFYFERLRIQTQASNFALKSAILINGGASVAMLAFIGHLSNVSEGNITAEHLSSSLIVFAIGTLVAAIASGATYLAEFYRTNFEFQRMMEMPYEHSELWVKIWVWTALSLVVTSYVSFIGGVYCTYTAIKC